LDELVEKQQSIEGVPNLPSERCRLALVAGVRELDGTPQLLPCSLQEKEVGRIIQHACPVKSSRRVRMPGRATFAATGAARQKRWLVSPRSFTLAVGSQTAGRRQ
jgi:hypothetical protein